ncbi:MAG: YraN family protein [Roseinatronobacter sp.]
MKDGARNHHAGLAAEDSVLRQYLTQGYRLLARRWRGLGGELDLVLGKGDAVIFVEVKKSRCFDRALGLLGGTQVQRLFQTAEQYLGTCRAGLNTPSRLDVALVNELGEVRVIENALA